MLQDTTRTWRRAAAASATPPAAAARGPWRTTVRPAQHLAPNSTKAAARQNAPLGLTMQLKLWNAKVKSLVINLKSSCVEKKVQMILKYGGGIVAMSLANVQRNLCV